jgi:DNA mismatch endonuclease (patch repair protein)
MMSVRLSLTERMARIRKTDTKPEMLVRRTVHGLGYRFRLHRSDLPGCPDLALPRHRKVIFVHGCFWHRHDCRDGRKLPHSKPEYWGPKLARNAARDARHKEALAALGWDVLVLWECEIRDAERMACALRAFLTGRGVVPLPASQ